MFIFIAVDHLFKDVYYNRVCKEWPSVAVQVELKEYKNQTIAQVCQAFPFLY